jgi:hypothetical protein
MPRLDTLHRGSYKSAPFVAVLVWVMGAGAARAELVHGAQLPDRAEKVGENRYRAQEDYEALLKYYRTVYPVGTYPRKPVANQPGVKAIHIVNPSGKGWEGMNVYHANDEVRIFIIPAPEPKPVPRKKPAEKRKN